MLKRKYSILICTLCIFVIILENNYEAFSKEFDSIEKEFDLISYSYVNGIDDDLPPKDVYENRLRKEINRAFAQGAGAGLSLNKPCVMEPAFSLRELDAIQFPVISPEAMSKIQEVGNKKKIGRIVTKTYKTACEEGWAPAPTNDIQKAIWDNVRSLPTKPMKIEYDPAKGK